VQGEQSSGEQVAGAVPTGSTGNEPIATGLCGTGIASTLAMTLTGLALLKRCRP